MDMKSLIPWNWFKHEEKAQTPEKQLMVPRPGGSSPATHPFLQLHQQIDRLFDDAFRGFGLPSLWGDSLTATENWPLKPSVDVAATDNAYTITVDVPGLEEKDLKLELARDTLTIRGEKKQESEQKDKHFYRVERSYGAFQRVLSLPEDAVAEEINASMKNGVLTLTLPRKQLAKTDVRQIEIQKG